MIAYYTGFYRKSGYSGFLRRQYLLMGAVITLVVVLQFIHRYTDASTPKVGCSPGGKNDNCLDK